MRFLGGACHRSVRDAKDGVMGSSDSGAGARDESAALLIRFAGGEAEAFVAFYRLNLSAVVAFFLRRTRDREVTADLTAEVFAAALIAAPRYDPGRPALAWLHGIASHKLADSRRRGRVEDWARRRLALEPLALDDGALDRVEEMASAHAGRDALEAAVGALPVQQREAVLARVVGERSYPEIAAEMACSEMVVRQRVSRGLKTLRSRLEEPK
jgi:RNA polymerase sigma factor (sigma-70 family)